MAASSSPQEESSLTIKVGDTVLLEERDERHSIVKLKAGCTVRVGKAYVPSAPLIGAHFGSMFALSPDGKSLEALDEPPESTISKVTETERDNSSLFDRGTENQRVQAKDVEAMKAQGLAAQDIVGALMEGSATFGAKTEFSQEKWKRRKVRKYLLTVTVRRPTARQFCLAYYGKGPERVFNLRPDSLAIMLSLANVAAGSRVLVVETCMGLVTAAVVERLGGCGTVCAAALANSQPPLDVITMMNLTPGQRACVQTASLDALLQAAAAPAPAPAAKQQPQQQEAASSSGAAGSEHAGAAGLAMEVDEQGAAAAADGNDVIASRPEAAEATEPSTSAAGAAPQQSDAEAARAAKQAAYHARMHKLTHPGFTSCILACPKVVATKLAQAVLPLLQPSAQLVMYSQWSQPLAECLMALHNSRQAVALQLQESWLRPYQVLPSRTHPHMTASGTGGYILSGIKVVDSSGSRCS